VGSDALATASIWRLLLDADWIRSIRARLLPVDHPLLLLLAEVNPAQPRVQHALWVRLVEVEAALRERGYAAERDVVIEVRDGSCPWNEGRFRVGAGRTTATADVALDVAELGAAYLGGFTFRQLARAGRIEELRPGAIDALDAMFRTDCAPWAPETF
jgi:predicted acetyltransferase